MELIKAHNESIEGNEAIRQINIELLNNEIAEVEGLLKDRSERAENTEFEELEDILEALLDQLDEVKNS